MTDTETIAAFRAEENVRYAAQSVRVDAALRPWAQYMKLSMTSTQVAAVRLLARKTLVEADYFGNKPNLTVKVDLKTVIEGRKGSPNKVISGSVMVEVNGHISGGAGCWFVIGKRGKVSGSLRGFGFCGSETKL
jgi:hypothetical protein